MFLFEQRAEECEERELRVFQRGRIQPRVQPHSPHRQAGGETVPTIAKGFFSKD
jgi:hypothetical protein